MVHQSSELQQVFENVARAWPMFLMIVGFICWLMRLEAKTNYNEKSAGEKFKLLDSKDESLQKTLVEMQKDSRDTLQIVSKIQGHLEGSNNNNKNH